MTLAVILLKMKFGAKFMVGVALAACAWSHPVNSSVSEDTCTDDPVRFEIPDPPYSNYFYSDCNSASQVVVTSPLPDSNLTIIGPRLLVRTSPTS